MRDVFLFISLASGNIDLISHWPSLSCRRDQHFLASISGWEFCALDWFRISIIGLFIGGLTHCEPASDVRFSEVLCWEWTNNVYLMQSLLFRDCNRCVRQISSQPSH